MHVIRGFFSLPGSSSLSHDNLNLRISQFLFPLSLFIYLNALLCFAYFSDWKSLIIHTFPPFHPPSSIISNLTYLSNISVS